MGVGVSRPFSRVQMQTGWLQETLFVQSVDDQLWAGGREKGDEASVRPPNCCRVAKVGGGQGKAEVF